MIDTLILTTKATVPEETLRQWNSPIVYHHDHDNKIVYHNYNYHGVGEDTPHINYTKESGKLKVSVPSMPKFCFGTSAVAIDDNHVEEALSFLEQFVINAGVQELSPIETWQVAAADIYYDFNVGTEVSNYIKSLQSLSLTGYKGKHYALETASWVRNSKGRTIMFYDRETRCRDTREDAATTYFSNGVIRLEIETKAYDYSRYFGFTNVGSVFNSNVILPMLNRYLERFDLNSMRITTESDILRILTNEYGQKKALALMCYINSTYKGYRLDVHRSTLSRYKREIKAAGITPIIGIRRLEPFKIEPIPDTRARLDEADIYRQSLSAQTLSADVIQTVG